MHDNDDNSVGADSRLTYGEGDAFSTMTPLINTEMMEAAGIVTAQESSIHGSQILDGNSKLSLTGGFTMELSKEEQLERLREDLPGEAKPTSPRDASKRSFYHAVQKDNPAAKDEESPIKPSPSKNGIATYMGRSRRKKGNDEPLKIIDDNRAQNVFVMMESELMHPNEVFSEEQMNSAATKMNRRDAYLTRCGHSYNRKCKKMAFSFWHSQMEFLLTRLRHIGTSRIQTLVRRWLQRNTLQNLIDEWQVICYERWKALHGRFNYCTRDTPYSVTVDHKIYFRTKLDANRYSTFLRKICMKILKFISRKRDTIMKFFFKLWMANSSGLNEADLKYGHLDMATADIDEGKPPDTGNIGDYGHGQTEQK